MPKPETRLQLACGRGQLARLAECDSQIRVIHGIVWIQFARAAEEGDGGIEVAGFEEGVGPRGCFRSASGVMSTHCGLCVCEEGRGGSREEEEGGGQRMPGQPCTQQHNRRQHGSKPCL